MTTYSYLYGDKDQNTSSFNSGLYSSTDGNSDKLQVWTASNPLAFTINLDSKLTTATSAQITIKVFDADTRDLVNLRLTTQSGTTIWANPPTQPISQGNNGSGAWTSVTFTIPTTDLTAGSNYFRLFSAATDTQADKQFALDFAELTLTVPDNAAPQAQNDSYQLNEDGSVTGNVLANDSDSNGDTLTATLATGPAHGTLVLNANGSFTYTPAANYNGPDSFTYTASDGKGGTATATVSLTVTPVNDAPVAVDDTGTTAEDKAVTFTAAQLLGNDSDIDSATLTITAVGNAQNGTVTLNADGSVTFTPNANYNGPASFEYTVSDGALTDTGAVSLTVTPVNDAPVVANPIADQSVAEDTAWSFQVPANSFSDVDGDTLAYSATLSDGSALPGWLTFSAATRTFSGTPPQDWNGSLDVKVTASDGTLSASDTFTLTVSPVNDAPQAKPATASGDEDGGAITGQVTASDVDSTNLAYKLVAPVAGLTFNADGSYSYVPAKDFNGTVSFQFVAHDGELDSEPATVTLTINPVNDAPVFDAAPTVETDEDTATTITVSASDVDGDTLSYTAGAASHGTVTAGAGGTFIYTPDADFFGSDSFEVTVSDGNGGTAMQTISLTVNPVNDAPVAPATNTVSTDEDTTSTAVAIGATDIDSATLNYAIKAGAEPKSGSVTFDQAKGTFVYTPHADVNGTDSFTILVSDGDKTVEQVVSVTINPVNDAPVATSGTASGDEDTVIHGQVPAATDVDGDTLTYSLVAGPVEQQGQLTFRSDGTFDFAPAPNFNGEVVFSYKANDGQADSNVQTVTITVAPVNDAPVAQPGGDAQGDEDTTITGQVPAAIDVDSDVLSYRLVDEVAGLTFNEDGSYSYTPAANFNGTVTFDYYVTDGELQSAPQTVIITVNPVNDAPTVVAPLPDVLVDEDTALDLGTAASFADVDADVLTYSAQIVDANGALVNGGALPGWLSIDAATGKLSGTPLNDDVGDIRVKVTASDGSLSASSTFKLTVANTNDAPVAVDDSGEAGENQTKSFDVLANDIDDDVIHGDHKTLATSLGAVSVISANQVVNGIDAAAAFSVENGQIKFTPGTMFDALGVNQTATVTVGYSVVDDAGATDAGVLTLTVTGANDAPVAMADTGSAGENDTGMFAVLANDTDVDAGDTKTLVSLGAVTVNGVAATAAQAAAFTIAGSQVQFAPGSAFDALAAGQKATVVVNYTMKDGAGATSSSALTLTIDGANDAATIGGTKQGAVTEDGVSTISHALTIADPDAGEAAFRTPTSLNGTYGSFTFNAGTGAWTYTLDNSRTATNSLVGGQKVSDTLTVMSHDGTATETITVGITGANDPLVVGRDQAHDAFTGSTVVGEDETMLIKISDLIANDIDADFGEGATFVSAGPTSSKGASVYYSLAEGLVQYSADATTFDKITSNTTDTFTYVVRDAQGQLHTGYVDINIAPVADAGDINLTNNVDNSGSNRSTASKGETINALNADDIVYGLGGDDRIFGGNGDDRLYGGDNSDYLDGGRGDDFLAGERGNDQLYGGLGNDVFAFGSHIDALSGTKLGCGTDIIWDFKVGNDRLQLGGAGDNVTIVDKRAFVANIDGDATTGVNGMESGTVLTLGHGTDASGNLITSTVYLVGVSNQIDTNHLLVA